MKIGWLRLASVAVCAISIGACNHKSESSAAQPGASASAPSAVAAAAPSASAGGAPVCTVSARTVWAKWANQRAGITATRLGDGRVALGVALGDAPALLVFDRNGKGELHRVSVPKDLPLGTDLKKAQGRRDLQRVTAGRENDGDLVAFADYRDRWNDGRRRIACGQGDEKAQLFEFDGTPLLDKPSTTPPPAQSGVAHAGYPPPRPAIAPRLTLPGAKVKPVAPIKPIKPMKPMVLAKQPLSEIRDCRTFVDSGGKDVWAAASELHGEEQADGNVKWSMRLLVLSHAGATPQSIYEVALPAEPKKLETFETAVAARRPSGGFVLFARYNGGLYGWTLDADHQRQGAPRRWGGGYPSPPRLAIDGGDLLALTALKHGANEYLPRFARIGPSGIPASLSPIVVAGAGSDLSEPVLARVGDQRWLAFNADTRRAGHLTVVPVDDKLASMGRSFDVTAAGESAYESYLLDLDGGRLLVVYIQGGSSPQLVSEQLACSVQG